jgi:hypothetical protein
MLKRLCVQRFFSKWTRCATSLSCGVGLLCGRDGVVVLVPVVRRKYLILFIAHFFVDLFCSHFFIYFAATYFRSEERK